MLELLMFATVTLIVGLAFPIPSCGKVRTAGETLSADDGIDSFARKTSEDPALAGWNPPLIGRFVDIA